MFCYFVCYPTETSGYLVICIFFDLHLIRNDNFPFSAFIYHLNHLFSYPRFWYFLSRLLIEWSAIYIRTFLFLWGHNCLDLTSTIQSNCLIFDHFAVSNVALPLIFFQLYYPLSNHRIVIRVYISSRIRLCNYNSEGCVNIAHDYCIIFVFGLCIQKLFCHNEFDRTVT